MANIKISGLAELRTGFVQLSADMQGKTALRMVAAAGGVLRKEAKAIAQAKGLKKSGALIKNIAIKREKTPAGIAQYNLGVRSGRDLGRKAKKFLAVGASGRIVTKRENDPFYARFLEHGTRNMSAKSFLAPALDNKRTEAIDAMGIQLQKTLDKVSK